MLEITSYVIYLIITVAMVIWVGRSLYQNGKIFLFDAFHGNEKLADSINHLLVIGFYLINLGYIAIRLPSEEIHSITSAFETASVKIGWILLTIGMMHFFNVYLFTSFRKGAIKKIDLNKNKSFQLTKTTD